MLIEVIKLVEYAKRVETENRELHRQLKKVQTKLDRIQGFVKSLDKEEMHQ